MSNLFEGLSIETFNLTGLNTSSVTNMSGMFRSSHIDDLDISSFDTSSVTDMSYMFASLAGKGAYVDSTNSSYCTVVLGNFETTNVVNMSHTFYGGTFFGVDLTDYRCFNVENVTDFSGLFYGNRMATVINLTDWDLSAGTNFTDMFKFKVHYASVNFEKIICSVQIKAIIMAHNGESGDYVIGITLNDDDFEIV